MARSVDIIHARHSDEGRLFTSFDGETWYVGVERGHNGYITGTGVRISADSMRQFCMDVLDRMRGKDEMGERWPLRRTNYGQGLVIMTGDDTAKCCELLDEATEWTGKSLVYDFQNGLVYACQPEETRALESWLAKRFEDVVSEPDERTDPAIPKPVGPKPKAGGSFDQRVAAARVALDRGVKR